MPEQNSLLVDVLDGFRRDIANLNHQLADIQKDVTGTRIEAVGIREEVRGLKDQVIRQNGRVGKLEESSALRAIRDAQRETEHVTRGEIALSWGAVARISSLTGFLVGALALVKAILEGWP